MRSSLEAAVIRSAGKWGFSEVWKEVFLPLFLLPILVLADEKLLVWVEASLNLCSAAWVMHGTILGETGINIYSPPYRVPKVKYHQSPAWWVSEFYWGHLHEQELFKDLQKSTLAWVTFHKSWEPEAHYTACRQLSMLVKCLFQAMQLGLSGSILSELSLLFIQV